MAKPRLVVFDLDGTLVDSLRDLAESVNELLVSYGAQPQSLSSVGKMVGDGAATLVARAFAAAALPQPPEALPEFLRRYNARLVRFTRPYPGIPEALEELGARASLAVLTNKPLGPTRQILQALDLDRFFESSAVLGGDGPLPRKPDPEGLRHLMARVGAAPTETVMVGDSAIDWHTARAAGALACLVRYGFGFQSIPEGALGESVLIADTAAALERLL